MVVWPGWQAVERVLGLPCKHLENDPLVGIISTSFILVMPTSLTHEKVSARFFHGSLSTLLALSLPRRPGRCHHFSPSAIPMNPG